ncbi:MAG: SAM-dependent methyltransferase [Candidatus Competibacteraceae bacterium]
MKHRPSAEVWEWLQKEATLNELSANYPQEWETVQRELSAVLARGQVETLRQCVERSSAYAALALNSVHKSSGTAKAWETALPRLIRNRMIQLAVKNHCLITATGVTQGKVRFNYLNGYVTQKLLFSRDLDRKPVSLFWFRLIWPLIWQKRLLMPLVQPKGIYCFYSWPLIAALAKIMAERTCLEIAAGDGTLTRFLVDRGINIIATDNYSWQQAVKYPESVVNLDARAALTAYLPEIVICSWPPAGNTFERYVFKTPSVQCYIVISSRHRFAAGNWTDYQAQSAFTIEEDQTLSRLVLPPELDAAVYRFQRRSSF